MNEQENMEMIEVTEEPEIVEEESSQMSTGMAMVIGSALTLAGIAAVKYGKKAVNKVKEMRAKSKAKKDMVVDLRESEVDDEEK